jgi:hypothetical protein
MKRGTPTNLPFSSKSVCLKVAESSCASSICGTVVYEGHPEVADDFANACGIAE